MNCPRCSAVLREGELLCPKCGYAVDLATNTITLKVNPLLRMRRDQGENVQTKDISVEPSRQWLTLRIRGMTERIDRRRLNGFTVGRSDLEAGFHPDLDLTAYGAAERGVSRTHITFDYSADQLTVTDQGSSNGTLLNGQKLTASQAYPLHPGDELVLGRLPMTVAFTDEP